MFLIVGLGNPTKQYAQNRHNVGFQAIDFLLQNTTYQNISKTSFKGNLFKSSLNDNSCEYLFLKPNTFMNLSGISVNAVSNFYKIPHEDIFVIYDDLDLSFGKLKFRVGGRDGGHNGIKSMNDFFKNEYKKLKIGIGRPEFRSQVSSYVLSDFREDEKTKLNNEIFCNIKNAISNISKKSFSDISSSFSL